MTGDKLIDGTAKFEEPFVSLGEAESAAHWQLQVIVGETFEVAWKENC
jgi:hypothetical protein